MVETIISFCRYFAALTFGAAIAVSFGGMKHTRKNLLVFGSFIMVIFILQIICLRAWGLDMTIKIYPLISHLPVAVFIVLYLKQTWLISLNSTFASFLCCQPPRWVGAVAGVVFDNGSMDHVGYILTAILMYYFLKNML